MYTFSGALARDGILPDAKFTLHPSLAFSYTGSVILHGTPVAGVSQILRRGTRNGITELTQRAPPIFGWAAITLADILVMATLCNRAGHYIFALWFLSSICLSSFFSSPNLSGRRVDVYHTSTHGVAFVRI